MTGALTVGAVFGFGLVLAISGIAPAPVPLARELQALRRPRPRTARGNTVASRVAAPLRASAFAARLPQSTASDLRITGTALDQHLAQRVGFGLLALVLAPATWTLATLAGLHLSFALPVWVSLLLAPAGFMYPALSLKSRAAARRRSLRHAFGAFLDIVAVSLAGGRGVETALHDAANAGHGWQFREFQQALLEAQFRGETPWAALNRLGADLGVPELSELAASAALAGSEGARVRASLTARARTVRHHGLMEVETAAHSASELMSLPVVLLMFGFVIFLGYPAVAHVLAGF